MNLKNIFKSFLSSRSVFNKDSGEWENQRQLKPGDGVWVAGSGYGLIQPDGTAKADEGKVHLTESDLTRKENFE